MKLHLKDWRFSFVGDHSCLHQRILQSSPGRMRWFPPFRFNWHRFSGDLCWLWLQTKEKAFGGLYFDRLEAVGVVPSTGYLGGILSGWWKCIVNTDDHTCRTRFNCSDGEPLTAAAGTQGLRSAIKWKFIASLLHTYILVFRTPRSTIYILQVILESFNICFPCYCIFFLSSLPISW